MKNNRKGIEIKDFSGGQVTVGPLIGTDLKYSPDCLNVYADPSLRKRDGFSKLNSATVGTNPNGNGIFNWVINASQQFILGFFGNTVHKMSTTGNAWSGTFTEISKNANNGTNFSDDIVSSVIYSGNFIFTTESRDKPQVITTTGSSYQNVESTSGGAGTSPKTKFLQVWKSHLWLLNLGAGGQLTEDGNTISNWTDNDVGTGESSETTFTGLSTFRFHGGTNSGDNARRTRTVTASTSYNVEIKTYFATLGAVTSNDYAWMDIYNGVIRFRTRWSTDGIEVFNGANWLEVGVNSVSTGTWTVWKFFVTGAVATASYVDVYKDSSPLGLQFSCANASTASSGQVDLVANAGGSASRSDWYMDYIYINTITGISNYYKDEYFDSWVSLVQASYTDNPLPSARPYTHLLMEDSAANFLPHDAGSSKNTITSRVSATTVNTSVITASGKIGKCFSFTSASAHNLIFSTTLMAAINADTTGTVSMWINPATLTTGDLVSFSNTTNSALVAFNLTTDGAFNFLVTDSAGSAKLNVKSAVGSFSTNAWNHLGVVQNGTAGPLIYINAATVNLTYVTSTNKDAWNGNVGTTMTSGFIAVRNNASGGITTPYNGRVDDFRYYRTALTTAEIKAIYAEGTGTQSVDSVYKEVTTIYTGTNSYGALMNGYAVVSQTLSSGSTIAGIASIFGGFFNVGTENTYKLRVDDGSTVSDSAIITGTNTWDYQTLSFTPTSSTGTIKAQVVFYGEANPEKTTLLLHAIAADGSTSIQDHSCYNRTVTCSGDAQVDTAQSVFGGAAILFDGTGDYITIPDAQEWQFGDGSGDWTVDFWIRVPSLPGAGSLYIMSQQEDGSNYWGISYSSTGAFNLFATYTAGVLVNVTTPVSVLVVNTWTHVAVVRTSLTYKIFINGVSQTLTVTTDTGGAFNDLVGNLVIGSFAGTMQYTLGWLDEVRFSKLARWTSNFTVPSKQYQTAYLDQFALINTSEGITNDLSDRLQRTAVATYNDFNGSDSGYNDITTPQDVGLTGSAILNDKMYVFKKWSIHRITYTASTPLLDIKQAKATVGTASPRSIKNVDIPEKGEVLMFLGTDRRIYIFDGYEALSVGDNIAINNGISSIYLKNINTQALDEVHAVYHSDLGWYELFIPVNPDTDPAYSILVDLKSKPFAFWPYNNRNFGSANVSDNGSGERVVYSQHNTNGFTYLLNDTSKDDGSAIDSRWTSFKAGSPVVLSRIDEIEAQTDSVVCTPVLSWRMDWESSYISKTLSSSSYSHNYNPGRIDNIVQFKFADNSTTASFKLWSLGAYERVLGGGK